MIFDYKSPLQVAAGLRALPQFAVSVADVFVVILGKVIQVHFACVCWCECSKMCERGRRAGTRESLV